MKLVAVNGKRAISDAGAPLFIEVSVHNGEKSWIDLPRYGVWEVKKGITVRVIDTDNNLEALKARNGMD